MDALIECSVFSGDETDLTVREKYQRMAAEQGNQAVHTTVWLKGRSGRSGTSAPE